MTTTYNVMQAARQWKRDSAEGRLINDLADLVERLPPNPFARHAFTASAKHPEGYYRLTVGFDTLEQVQAAHEYVVQAGVTNARTAEARS